MMSGYSLPKTSDISPRRQFNLTDDLDRPRRHERASYTEGYEPPRTQMDQVQKFAGFSIGLSSLFAEQLLSHPFHVLRRQCQVNYNGESYHCTPFTLFTVLLNLQRHQGMATLWKGVGSVYVVKGVFMVTETAISEFTPLPKEITRHSSIKKILQHLLLKSTAFMITSPFYAASLIETIQSDIASERPGILDSLREGMTRVMGWGMPQTTRLFPIYRLILPTATFRLCHYLITSVAQYTVISTIKVEQQESRENRVDQQIHESVFDVYFPELLAAFTGSLLADTMLFPFETVLHRLYVQGTRTIIDDMDSGLGVIPLNTAYEGIIDCFKRIIYEEGLGGLYKGFGALVMQYIIHAAILKTVKFLLLKVTEEFQQPRSARRPLSSSHIDETDSLNESFPEYKNRSY